MEEKKTVAAFDFDGTLTRGDTLTAFIRFTHGWRRLLWGFLQHTHWLLLIRLGLYPSARAKEKIICHFYKGTAYSQFVTWGREFADVAESMLNCEVLEKLREHQAAGHTVCVVTASIDEWVRPVCEKLGVKFVIATRVEVSSDGKLTGRLLTLNCNGEEKVRRLLEVFPQRQAYTLYAYGDSHGDDALLALADVSQRVYLLWKNSCGPVM